MPELAEATVENQINPDQIDFLVPVQENNNPLIPIFVKGLDGKTMTAQVTKNAYIFEIKEQVAQKTGIPVLDQRLQYGSKQVEDQLQLMDYNIHKEATLHLSLRLAGGMGEHAAVQAFLKAKIEHGNVKNLITKKSDIAMEYYREEFTPNYIESSVAPEHITFEAPYDKDEQLQFLCGAATMVGSFKGGNCAEMAQWTAVELIENTSNQWIYICSLDGEFPLKEGIAEAGAKHALYDPKAKAISNQFDHVLLITYPEQTSVDKMDLDKATVVDVWYNNLVCSLKDYLGTKHPYYNYQYSSKDNLALEAKNIKIEGAFKAVGKPFSKDKSKLQKRFDQMKDFKQMMGMQKPLEERLTKFDFQVGQAVQDERSLANLEALLLASKKENKANEECNRLSTAAFAKLLTSQQKEVLAIVYKSLEFIATDAVRRFGKALIQAKAAAFDQLFAGSNKAIVADVFQYTFSDQEVAGLMDYLKLLLSKSALSPTQILDVLTKEQLKSYTLHSPENLQQVMALSGLQGKLVGLLSLVVKPEDWKVFWATCKEQQIKEIIEGLLKIDQAMGKQVEKTITK